MYDFSKQKIMLEVTLELLKENSLLEISSLGGGTALAGYYWNHRYSTDIDIFIYGNENKTQLLKPSDWSENIKSKMDSIGFNGNFRHNNIYTEIVIDKDAKIQLTWAISHAKESSVSAIASLQLANILVEEKSYDAALKILEAKHDAGFDGLFADLKGDVLLGLGKRDEAKAAYELALTKLDPQGRYRHLTQQKIHSLG